MRQRRPRHIRAVSSFLLPLALLISNPGPAAAEINIVVTGSWNEVIDRNDLSAGAGSDLAGSFTSSNKENLITINGTMNKRDNWQVSVKRVDTLWDGRMRLFVRRTSNGAGPGTISGGEAFVPVAQNDVVFFTGAGNLNNIRVQLQVTGTSIELPPNVYTSTIQYTVIDTP